MKTKENVAKSQTREIMLKKLYKLCLRKGQAYDYIVCTLMLMEKIATSKKF